jgi:hypothetical protein
MMETSEGKMSANKYALQTGLSANWAFCKLGFLQTGLS